MVRKRDILVFFFGFEVAHTIAHGVLSFTGLLPLRFAWLTITENLNVWAIVVNAVISAGLLLWLLRLHE